MGELNPFAPPGSDGPRPERPVTGEGVRFFPVSRTKFVVMHLATFGVYQLYWFYKQWKYTKLRTRSDIWPIARSLFSIFFTHALLRDVRIAAVEAEVEPSYRVQASAWGFIILSLLYRLPDPFWLVALFAFVPLVPVQDTINEINRRTAPTADTNSGFGVGNWVAIVLGLSFWALNILALFVFPEEPVTP